MEKYTMFMDWKNQYCQNDYTTQSNLQIQCNPYQATNGILHRTRTNNFTICMEIHKTSNSQSNLVTVDFKGQIPVPMCIRHQDKVTTATASRTLLPLQTRWSRQPPIPFITEQEREPKAQEREKRKKTRHAQMLAALQGSPMAHPKPLNDKARGKCLICRQAGHWAKDCPNP